MGPTRFYLLLLSPSGRPGRLTPLPIAVQTREISGLALSRDGRQLAVSFLPTGQPADGRRDQGLLAGDRRRAGLGVAGPRALRQQLSQPGRVRRQVDVLDGRRPGCCSRSSTATAATRPRRSACSTPPRRRRPACLQPAASHPVRGPVRPGSARRSPSMSRCSSPATAPWRSPRPPACSRPSRTTHARRHRASSRSGPGSRCGWSTEQKFTYDTDPAVFWVNQTAPR